MLCFSFMDKQQLKKYCTTLSFDNIYFIFNVKYDHEYDYQPISSFHTKHKLCNSMFNVL